MSDKLERVGCVVQHAKGDTDTLIIIIAVKYADIPYTVLVGEDAGMLVLLCYHAKNLPKAIYFRPEKSYIQKATEDGIQNTRHILKEITYTQHDEITEAGAKAIVSMYNG